MLTALEVGVGGVVLRTQEAGQVTRLAERMAALGMHVRGAAPQAQAQAPRQATGVGVLDSADLDTRGGGANNAERPGMAMLEAVRVARVVDAGVGDRACVDLTERLSPGEGMLVGNFARALFLVHSECLDAEGYVNARPFRVNAGAVHAYCLAAGDRTAYLSELRAGARVAVVGARP